MRHRLTEPAQLPQRDAQIVVIDRDIAAEPDRLADQINSSRMTTTLIGDDPKQMQSVWLPRVYRKELPVRPFSFSQPTGLVVTTGVREQVLNDRGSRQLGRAKVTLPFVRQAALLTVHGSLRSG
jgi:hypothetical protein